MGFRITHTQAGGYSVTMPPMPQEQRDTVRHAVQAYGFLIPRGTTCTGPEFGALIREHYNNHRTDHIAEVLHAN